MSRSSTEDRRALLQQWRAEETGPPGGFDFTDLRPRMAEDPVPWDLDAEYRAALTGATAVLDLGTGGGEFLLSVADALPADTTATEGWATNVPIARAALGPAGVEVVAWCHDETIADRQRMPFPDDRFDLVLNRHEAYDPAEVLRVLRPGGDFLTQQVGGTEFGEIRSVLHDHARFPEVTHAAAVAGLRAAGFDLDDGAEHRGHYRFRDVAALVAYLQRIPWDAPDDFTVDRYADELIGLHTDADGGPVLATRIRFWLRAHRPTLSPGPADRAQ